MDHAEAHELLADLAFEPARLRALESDASPEAAPLRAHVDLCETCAQEVAAWRRTWVSFADARASARPSDFDMLKAPAGIRARVMEAVVTAPPVVPVGASRRWAASRRLPWLAVAAALVVALGAGSLAWIRTAELGQAQTEAAELASVAATMDRVLADPVHWITPLQTADGAPGGTLVWSNTEIAVVTSALPTPEPGQTYRCWVEHDGKRTPIGAMDFTGGTGYWVGSMSGWGGLLEPGARFGVSLVPASGGGGAPVLIGSI